MQRAEFYCFFELTNAHSSLFSVRGVRGQKGRFDAD
jgi:hypothetical protein